MVCRIDFRYIQIEINEKRNNDAIGMFKYVLQNQLWICLDLRESASEKPPQFRPVADPTSQLGPICSNQCVRLFVCVCLTISDLHELTIIKIQTFKI